MRKAVLEKLKNPPAKLPRWVGSLDAWLKSDNKTSCPRIHVRCDKKVSADVARVVRHVATNIAKLSPPQHEVRVVVVASFTIDSGDGMPAHGFFSEPSEPTADVVSVGIAIATGFYEEANFSRKSVIDGILQVLGHEYAHYEQWRDGRLVTERGVEVRGRNLVAMSRKTKTNKLTRA